VISTLKTNKKRKEKKIYIGPNLMCGPLGKFSGYIVLSSLIFSTIQVCMLVVYIKLSVFRFRSRLHFEIQDFKIWEWSFHVSYIGI